MKALRRSRGEGRIYRPWYIDKAKGERKQSKVWWIAYHRDGEKIRESSKSEKRADAAKFLRERLSAIAQGRPVGPDVDKTTYDNMAGMLEDSFVVNHRRSLKRLRGALKHLGATFKGALARNIDEARIGAYIRRRLDEGAANGTINRELTALKRMFSLALRAQRVVRRPYIEMLAEATPRQGFVERDQYEAIMERHPADLHPLVTATYVTGWRVASEILTREWKHVDFGTQQWPCGCAGLDGRPIVRTIAACSDCGRFRPGWLRLEPGETKNGKGRMFRLVPELRAALEQQRDYTDAVEREQGRIVPWVFHRNGERVVSFRRSWQKACREAGLPGLIPHDLRRTAVRNLERAGVPRSTAMAMVGHQTESIYRRYAIVDETMLREGAEKLAALHDATKNTPRRVVPHLKPMRAAKG